MTVCAAGRRLGRVGWGVLLMLVLLLGGGPALAAEQVYVYNWTEYIPAGVLQQFTAETGIEVVYNTFASNEAMYAKLKGIARNGYDVVCPSSYYVHRMAREGMLQPLDRSKLSGFARLDPALLDKPYDPGNRFSVPYLWGSTGIAVNSKAIDPDSITGWQSLWAPRWRGQLLLHDDVREVFHMALRIKGYASNTTDPQQVAEAYALLQELMPNVRQFDSASPRLAYLAGEAHLGMIWNGEAYLAQEENADIHYIYPKEGAVFWVDNFVIPTTARNVAAAHAFIDFMLRPEVAKECVEEIGYATPNREAMALLPESLRTNPVIFPDAATLARGTFLTDVGEATALYQDYWERLKAGY